jgi:beta-xylosidase
VVSGLLLPWGTRAATDHDFYLFTSFRGNGEDGLHLALSINGYQWVTLNRGRSYLRPEVGGKLMRDPCLAAGPDGRFHLVWTTGWTAESGKVFGYAWSANLTTWSTQRAVAVLQDEPKTRNIWAPELFYDSAQRQWVVFWSSTIPGKFKETDAAGDAGYNHRIYATTTRDFETFGPSRLFYDPGFNVIDATLLAANGRFWLFFKDERKNPLKKNLRYAIADRPTGPFGPPSEPFTGDWVEGPSAVRIKDEYLVYFDHYAQPQYYGAVRSKDLKQWEDCSREMTFPPGHRHGTVLRIPEALARQLQAASP